MELQVLEPGDECSEPAPAHAALLAYAGLAFHAQIEFPVAGQEFDTHALTCLMPGELEQLGRHLPEAAFGCADEVLHGRKTGMTLAS